jgi:hypothetical protein
MLIRGARSLIRDLAAKCGAVAEQTVATIPLKAVGENNVERAGGDHRWFDHYLALNGTEPRTEWLHTAILCDFREDRKRASTDARKY